MSGKGIVERFTEIPDSEDELFTSSPAALPYGPVSQLDGTTDARPQDASLPGGGSPDLPESATVNPRSEHPAKRCIDEQPAVLNSNSSLDAGAPVNPESDLLQPSEHELHVSNQNASSLTDSCESFNHLSKALTELPHAHILNKPYAAETASNDGEKEQSTSDGESVSSPMIETSYGAASPTSAIRDPIAANKTPSGCEHQPVLPLVENDTDSVRSEIPPTVSTAEDGLPDTQHDGQRLTDSGIGDQDGDGDLSPAISSSSSNNAPRGWTMMDRATPTEQIIEDVGPECAGFSKLPESTTEKNIQPSALSANGSVPSPRDVAKGHIDRDLSTPSVPESPAPKQPQVASNGEHDPVHPKLMASADLTPSIFPANKSTGSRIDEAVGSEEPRAPPMETSGTALPKLDEARADIAINSKKHIDQARIEPNKESNAPLEMEVAATEPIPDALKQASSSAASTTEDLQSSAAKSPQEITIMELKAKKAALIASLAQLPAIQTLLAETRNLDGSSPTSNAEPTESEVMAIAHQINKKHIKLLHEYNEMKDVGQGLMGIIADQRGVRIVEVQDDFGIDAKD